MSNKFTELTIDEFYQKEMFNENNVIIHNGKYYYDVSNFKKIKMRKHGMPEIFFNYFKNNKTELKTLHLHKIIEIENNKLNDEDNDDEDNDEIKKLEYN